MKRTGFICLAASLLFAGCQSNTDNNKSLDFDELEVNFTVKTGGIELPAGAQFAVCGLCTRGGEENVNMGTGAVTRYRVAAAGTQAALVKESEADAIVARSDDHNFRFFAVSPAVEAIGETIAVNVPSVQEDTVFALIYQMRFPHVFEKMQKMGNFAFGKRTGIHFPCPE